MVTRKASVVKEKGDLSKQVAFLHGGASATIDEHSAESEI
jgi:hypothetical protein